MLSSAHEVAEKYAQAIFDLGQEENALDKVAQDIYFICDLLSTNEQLKSFLENPFEEKETRKQVIVEIFKSNVEPISLNFLLVLVEKKMEKLLPLIVRQFNVLLYEKKGTVEVRVTTARELSKEDYEKITQRLSDKLQKPVILNKRVDKNIIGGMIVQIGDKLINGSIARKLNDYEQLAKQINDEQKGA